MSIGLPVLDLRFPSSPAIEPVTSGLQLNQELAINSSSEIVQLLSNTLLRVKALLVSVTDHN